MSPWIPWLYVYGVGGLVFVTFVMIGLRAGAVRPGHRPDRLLLGVLAGGLLAFMTLHAVWIALVT